MDRSKILVIEDDATIAMFMEMVLSAEGYQVTLASDSETGLAAAQNQPPALILMDMNLRAPDGSGAAGPGRAGVRLFRALRNLPLTVPVIAVTADTRAAETALAEGMTDTLLKPFDVDDLFAIVARYTGLTHDRTETD